MTMHERMQKGLLFTDMCEGLPEERLAAKRRMKRLNELEPDDFEGRAALLDEICGKPTTAWVEPPFYFCYGTHITLGERCYLNMGCTFVDDGSITVGDRVMFGPGVTVATVGHPVSHTMREYMFTAPVTIGDDCWLGANVTVCPGVTIGARSVIGAGSVVVRDVPAGCVAAGNPCRVLRKIDEMDLLYYGKSSPVLQEDLEEERRLRGASI